MKQTNKQLAVQLLGHIRQVANYVTGNTYSTEHAKSRAQSLLSQAEKHANAKCFSRHHKGDKIRQQWHLDQLYWIRDESRNNWDMCEF